MGTSKWYALDRVVKAFQQIVRMEYVEAGLFESSHEDFKKRYNRISRKRKMQ